MGRLMLSLQLAEELTPPRIPPKVESNHVDSDPESSGSENEMPDLVVDSEELEEEEEADRERELSPVVKWSPNKPFDPDSEEFWKRENVVYEAIRSPSPSPEVSDSMAPVMPGFYVTETGNDGPAPSNFVLFASGRSTGSRAAETSRSASVTNPSPMIAHRMTPHQQLQHQLQMMQMQQMQAHQAAVQQVQQQQQHQQQQQQQQQQHQRPVGANGAGVSRSNMVPFPLAGPGDGGMGMNGDGVPRPNTAPVPIADPGLPSAGLFDMNALLSGSGFDLSEQFDIETWLNPN